MPRRRETRVVAVLQQLWLPLLLVAIWYVASLGSTNFYYPPLQTIAARLGDLLTTAGFWGDIVASLRNLAAGLALGVLAGIVFGVLIGSLRFVRAVLDPYLQFARSIPQVALVPIIIGILGIQAAPKIYVIAVACVWPVLLNTIDGIRGIDPSVRDMARAYRIPRRQLVFRVMLPATLPQIAAGIRVSLSIGVVIMVVSEAFGATEGIGYFINRSGASFDVAGTWAGTLVVGTLGYLLSTLFLVVERFALRWYHASAE